MFTNPLVTVHSADGGTEQCHFNILLHLVHCKQGGKVYVHVLTYTCTCMYRHTQLCRWDMTVPEVVYNSPPPHGKGRTLETTITDSSFSQPKKHLGSKEKPILQTEPSNLVIDELHLLLRIGDVLLRNVILQANSLDHMVYMKEGRRSDDHLRMLETLVRRCGVTFIISPVRSLNTCRL